MTCRLSSGFGADMVRYPMAGYIYASWLIPKRDTRAGAEGRELAVDDVVYCDAIKTPHGPCPGPCQPGLHPGNLTPDARVQASEPQCLHYPSSGRLSRPSANILSLSIESHGPVGGYPKPPTMPSRTHINLATSLCAPRRRPAAPCFCGVRASFATKSEAAAAPSTTPAQEMPNTPPSRWVSDVRARIGKCIMFGCDAAQVQRAAGIVGALARDWRVLSAGSEGFLAGARGALEDQQVVWGEMDSFAVGERLGHVNNATYIRYAESARVNWILHFAVQDPKHREAWKDLMRPKGIGLIMKSIKADYKFPMTAPDTISVYHRLGIHPEATHTSLILDCIILSHRHRRIAARTSEDIAIYDYRAAKKAVLPGFMLDALRDTWRRQEERAGWARERIWGLLEEVEALEKETWDREDAVEDLGAAEKRR
ncbi:hypothetical protein GQX73_g4987 [Xylaria multiplex]|uniref:Thioesterase domain-containing protein n=1 Tax=Xylaria multiplex TaxID=323545 RepID=A0A7C8MYD9_9PEZI|nr:hypothetical protein GQX73_g4987 [Xylaria multiplex]